MNSKKELYEKPFYIVLANLSDSEDVIVTSGRDPWEPDPDTEEDYQYYTDPWQMGDDTQ